MTGGVWLAMVAGMIAGGLIAAVFVPAINAWTARQRAALEEEIDLAVDGILPDVVAGPPDAFIVLDTCRVYWGSHGCMLPRHHDGDCICACAMEPDDDPDVLNVGAPPYYGEGETWFYGEDAEARGLPMINNEGNTDGTAV